MHDWGRPINRTPSRGRPSLASEQSTYIYPDEVTTKLGRKWAWTSPGAVQVFHVHPRAPPVEQGLKHQPIDCLITILNACSTPPIN